MGTAELPGSWLQSQSLVLDTLPSVFQRDRNIMVLLQLYARAQVGPCGDVHKGCQARTQAGYATLADFMAYCISTSLDYATELKPRQGADDAILDAIQFRIYPGDELPTDITRGVNSIEIPLHLLTRPWGSCFVTLVTKLVNIPVNAPNCCRRLPTLVFQWFSCKSFSYFWAGC